MEFDKIFSYTFATLLLLGVMYLIVFKSELLINKWIAWTVVTMVYIVLNHIRMVRKNGN